MTFQSSMGTGKVETIGSTFSNETAFAGCWRPNTTLRKVKNYYRTLVISI